MKTLLGLDELFDEIKEWDEEYKDILDFEDDELEMLKYDSEGRYLDEELEDE